MKQTCSIHFPTCLLLYIPCRFPLIFFSCCAEGLSWSDESDSGTKDIETCYLDGNRPRQVLVAYNRPVSFKYSMCCFTACHGVRPGGYLNTIVCQVFPDKTVTVGRD